MNIEESETAGHQPDTQTMWMLVVELTTMATFWSASVPHTEWKPSGSRLRSGAHDGPKSFERPVKTWAKISVYTTVPSALTCGCLRPNHQCEYRAASAKYAP